MSSNRQKRILVQTLSSDISWSSIGLDLAKFDLSVIGVSESDQLYGIDRIAYDVFFEMTAKMMPTVFAMEPCNGARAIAERLRGQGHIVRIISGNAVSAYVDSHLSGQKTDLNDAQALALLCNDNKLIPIREKTPHEARLLTLYTTRKHFVAERTSTIAAFKGMMQAWGVPIKKGLGSIKKKNALILEHAVALEQAVTDALLSMVEHVESLNKRILALNKLINAELELDERHKFIQSMPFVGPTTECRFLGTVGDINRFARPRHLQAFYGIVPRNRETSHNGRIGRMNKHGDCEMRTQIIQCAGCLFMTYSRGLLPDCGIKNWLDKKTAENMKYGLLITALAGKLVRILWALLIHGENFDFKRAGLSREAIKAISTMVVDTDSGVIVAHENASLAQVANA